MIEFHKWKSRFKFMLDSGGNSMIPGQFHIEIRLTQKYERNGVV